MAAEEEHLLKAFLQAKAKSHHLDHHQQFLKEHGGKLIQEGSEAFNKELHVLESEHMSSATLPDNPFFNPFVSEANADLIFSALSSDFWANLNIGENLLSSPEPFQGAQ